MKARNTPVVVLVLGLLLGGCGRANVYDATPDQVYSQLIKLKDGTPSAIDVEGVKMRIRGTPGKSVTWITDYAHSYYECTAYLTPEGASQTSINVGCDDKNAPGKFAMAKAIVNEVGGEAMAALPVSESFNGVRNRYIELVDSTLDARPFDNTRAKSHVMGWPDPPA